MLGLIGTKLGMTQLFNDDGTLVPLSIIQVEPNVVVQQRTAEKNGYSAMVLGSGAMKKTRVKKPYGGQFSQGVDPRRYLLEFKDFDKEAKIGDTVGVEIFEGVRFVDVQSATKGKGFQGVVRRHGFQGGPGAHGSKFHREMGSVGTGAFRKIVKGSKMPGRMGNAKLTVQNLRLYRVDKEKGLLLIKGAVPGRRGAMVVVRTATKK
ncbi:MAG: 50S ribosomal protein L3 [Spirochaetia bacterium]